MVGLHIAVGFALIGLNLAAFVVGGIAWLRKEQSVPFWYLLRAAQVSIFAQAAIGALLVVTNHEPKEEIHFLYGILPLVVSFIAEGARAGAAQRELADTDVDIHDLGEDEQQALALQIVRREMGIMAVSSGVILFIALRAAFTSGF